MQGTPLMGGRWYNGRPPARGVGGVADRGRAGAADKERVKSKEPRNWGKGLSRIWELENYLSMEKTPKFPDSLDKIKTSAAAGGQRGADMFRMSDKWHIEQPINSGP